MATATTHKAYETIASLLTTELNTLANDTFCSISAAQGADGTGGPLKGDFELVLASGRTSGGNTTAADLYIVPSADGTNYQDTPSSTVPAADCYAGTFTCATGTGAVRAVLKNIDLPPGLWKAIVVNRAGAAWAASANTLKVRAHSIATA